MKYVKDGLTSEDMVQQVFMKMWDKRVKLNPQMEVKPYLFVAVKNTCLNHIKVAKRSADMEGDQFDNLNAETGTAEDDLELAELQHCIDETIAALPPKCRQVFVLSRFEDKSYKEIAEEMGISVKTVENQMGKALRKLREGVHKYRSAVAVALIFSFFG